MDQITINETFDILTHLKEFKRAMRADELADVLGASRQELYKLAKHDVIPSFKVGTLVRFNPRQVAQALFG